MTLFRYEDADHAMLRIDSFLREGNPNQTMLLCQTMRNQSQTCGRLVSTRMPSLARRISAVLR